MSGCQNCGGTGSVPESGHEAPGVADNGYVPCPSCRALNPNLSVQFKPYADMSAETGGTYAPGAHGSPPRGNPPSGATDWQTQHEAQERVETSMRVDARSMRCRLWGTPN